MARPRESLWLWAGGSLVAGAAALVGFAGVLDAAHPGYRLWTSAPMIGAYPAVAVAIGCLAGAARGWPFPFASEQPDLQAPEQGDDRVAASQVGIGNRSDTAATNEAGSQVVVGEIPREPSAFVERQALVSLSEAVGSGQVAVVCAVTGLRGVGKTQLAAAYARDRINRGCQLVGWVNAESRNSLLADLARIAEAAGVADPKGDSAESARRLRDHLTARTHDSLLVFDNAANPDVVRPMLPAAGITQVVITSTNRAFAEFGTTVGVAVFSRAESVGYLAARTGIDDAAGTAAVAAELGDMPLGLAQAAAVIAGAHLTCQEYLERLRKVPVAKLLGRVRGGDYPYATAAALLLNVNAAEVGDASGLTSQLLRVVAILSAEGVRRRILDGLSTSDQASVDAAIQRCTEWSLLTWSVTGDTVIMHRLLARVLRERDQAVGEQAAAVELALELLESQFFDEDQAWERREEGADLAAHAEAICEQADDVAGDFDLTSRMLEARSWAVRQLHAAADLTRAMDLGERTLADRERVLGPDHPDTLRSRNNLAYAYQSAGRLAEGIRLFERTVADRERMMGRDHPDTISSRNNLAYAYDTAGRLGEAIPLFEQTIADSDRVLGPDHPHTLTYRNNLASAYELAGRLAEAIPLIEHTLAGRERVLGPDHPDTLSSRNNLAYVYESAGRLDEAIRLYEQNLADRERILGPDHPDSLLSRNNLANAYESAGRLADAVRLYEQNLADSERALGPEHPDTLNARNNLSGGYKSAGRLDEAIRLYERNLADRERFLGPHHPDTLNSRNNLACAREAAGQLAEAIPLYERTLADSERALGSDHLKTLTYRNNLAYAYQTANRLTKAIPLFERTLADAERLLGPGSPMTQTYRNDLKVAKRINRRRWIRHALPVWSSGRTSTQTYG